MVGCLNKVCLLGNVGRNPEIRTMQDGREMATFSIATSETWRDRDTNDKKTKTEWHRVVVFSEGLVRLIKKYIVQGSKLYIEGSLQTRKWIDANGVEKTVVDITLQGYNAVLLMLDSKGQVAALTNRDENARAPETAARSESISYESKAAPSVSAPASASVPTATATSESASTPEPKQSSSEKTAELYEGGQDANAALMEELDDEVPF